VDCINTKDLIVLGSRYLVRWCRIAYLMSLNNWDSDNRLQTHNRLKTLRKKFEDKESNFWNERLNHGYDCTTILSMQC